MVCLTLHMGLGTSFPRLFIIFHFLIITAILDSNNNANDNKNAKNDNDGNNDSCCDSFFVVAHIIATVTTFEVAIIALLSFLFYAVAAY